MRKNFNTTIDEETIALIEKLAVGRSKGQVVDEAVAMLAAPSRDGPSEAVVNRWFRETWKRMEDLPAEILAAADARRARKGPLRNPPSEGVSPVAYVGSPVPAPFERQCKHCPKMFRTANKFATICVECKHGGHSNEPGECPICTLAGTGAL